MNRTRNTLYLALVSALFLFAGTLHLRAATAQQPADQSDSGSTKKSSKPKQAPAAAPATAASAAASTPAAKPAPATTPPANTPAASTPAASKPAATQQTPPAKSNLMVWVNTDSAIYHKQGSRFYGKTKQGK